jgi:hypothetical protein
LQNLNLNSAFAQMEEFMSEDTRNIRRDTDGRDDKGRFGTGNPGRPRGARNRASVVAGSIIDDNLGEIVEKCIQLAKEGDRQCILALLKLRIPAQRGLVEEPIELPALATSKDALTALRIIAEGAARGEIDGDHVRSLVAIVEAFLKSLEIVDLDERIRALEAAQAKEDDREAA